MRQTNMIWCRWTGTSTNQRAMFEFGWQQWWWFQKWKLRAIENYEKSSSKHPTAKTIGCTRFQLSEWLKRKEKWKNLQSSKRGEPFIDRSSSFSGILLDWIVWSNIHLLFFIVGRQRKGLKGPINMLHSFTIIFVEPVPGVRSEDLRVRSHPKMFVIWTNHLGHCLMIRRNEI